MSERANLIDEISQAQRLISSHVRETYLLHSQFYSELTGANVYLKCENLQITGSFKLRGALNKCLSLTRAQRKHGIVAASTGNHGKAVAYANKIANSGSESRCTIFAPKDADPIKLKSIRDFGANVHLAGDDCLESELLAKQFASENCQTYVSPYNDFKVVAGQGTIGFEICNQLDQIDAVIGSMGGGGMLSGIGSFVKDKFPSCEIIGCSPENSNVMIQSLSAGKLLDLPSQETLSDGTAGGVEPGAITFELCQKMITQTISVSELEIAKCLVQFVNNHSMLIEGAAAVAVAALLRIQNHLQGKNVVVVLCGANISAQRLASII